MSHVQGHGPAVVLLNIRAENPISRRDNPALNLDDAKRYAIVAEDSRLPTKLLQSVVPQVRTKHVHVHVINACV